MACEDDQTMVLVLTSHRRVAWAPHEAPSRAQVELLAFAAHRAASRRHKPQIVIEERTRRPIPSHFAKIKLRRAGKLQIGKRRIGHLSRYYNKTRRLSIVNWLLVAENLEKGIFMITTFPSCPTELSEAQIAQYARDGFIALEDVLSPDEVEEARNSLSNLVDTLRENRKTLCNSYGEMWAAPDSRFKIQFERAAMPEGDADPDLELKVRKLHDFVGVDDNLTFLAKSQERIQGVLSGLIGRNPLLMQDMALVKPPFYGSEKPWHQDDAYFKVAPLEAVCGVWIALDEAVADNGCMHVLRGGHHIGALRHYHGSDCEITPDRLSEKMDVRDTVAVPLQPGGAIFFSGILPHFTPPNHSAQRRRALQFHYRSLDSRLVGDEEYDAIFVEADGSPASCSAAAKRGF